MAPFVFWESMSTQIEANQFLSGGLVLGALGATVASLRALPRMIWKIAERRVLLSIEVAAPDPTIEWFKAWLAAQPYSRRTGHLRLTAREDCEIDASENRLKRRSTALLTPAPGHHVFWYGHRLLWVDIRHEKVKSEGMVIGQHERLTITTLGQDQEFLRTLVEDAYQVAHPPDDDRIRVYSPLNGSWERVAERRPRPPESLIFDGDLFGSVKSDVEAFLAGRSWYEGMGIPWRRGYLLHGQPGCGKTSLVLALGGALPSDIYAVNLASSYVSDNRLLSLLSEVPEGSIVLLEEVDSLFEPRADRSEDGRSVSLAGLLTALDGVATPEGLIVFMTTNKPERLPPALIRQGRVDVQVKFGPATARQAEQMYLRFFADHPDDAVSFGRTAGMMGVSMAWLQEHLLSTRTDSRSAFDLLAESSQGMECRHRDRPLNKF